MEWGWSGGGAREGHRGETTTICVSDTECVGRGVRAASTCEVAKASLSDRPMIWVHFRVRAREVAVVRFRKPAQ